jgi:hypothetical protein
MLHIHNGDSTAGTAKHFGIPGKHFAFREALIDGPTPSGLYGHEWIRLRAEFLSNTYEPNREQVRSDLVKQDTALREFSDHDEVILWFEHDLFCQVNLVYLLDWFSRQELGRTRLSLICIGEFPGKPDFRGLGELSGDQLATLLGVRHEVTGAELKVGSNAWQAYCAPDPLNIAKLLEQDTSPLPYLKNALLLHLMRFPSVRNGLGRVENSALELISSGSSTFGSLFPRLVAKEPRFGFGDVQIQSWLWKLIAARVPLLSVGNLDTNDAPARFRGFGSAMFEITEAGNRVITGASDFIEENGLDAWLGGVHLKDDAPIWRWDEDRRELVQ